MKRFHVHLSVDDLPGNVSFYSALFGQAPTKQRDDYAKWMLDDPRINFAISTHGEKAGLSHLGVQVDNDEELQTIFSSLSERKQQMMSENDTQCCYARSDKHWAADPQGVLWEHFVTHGETTTYGQHAVQPATAACCETKAS